MPPGPPPRVRNFTRRRECPACRLPEGPLRVKEVTREGPAGTHHIPAEQVVSAGQAMQGGAEAVAGYSGRSVTAPVEAELTVRAYFDSTPRA